MPYTVRSTTVHDAPPSFLTQQTSRTSSRTGLDSNDNTTTGTTTFVSRSERTENFYETTWMEKATFGTDTFMSSTYMNRSLTSGTTTAIGGNIETTTVTREVSTYEIGETTQDTFTFFGAGTTTEITETTIWSATSGVATDTKGDTFTFFDVLWEETTTTVLTGDSPMTSVQVIKTTRASTFKETKDTFSCDTIRVSFPAFGETFIRLAPGVPSTDATKHITELTETLESYFIRTNYLSVSTADPTPLEVTGGGEPVGNIITATVTAKFGGGNLTGTRTFQRTLPISAGRQLSTTTEAFLSNRTSTQTVVRRTSANQDQEAVGNRFFTDTIETFVSILGKESSVNAGGLFLNQRYYSTASTFLTTKYLNFSMYLKGTGFTTSTSTAPVTEIRDGDTTTYGGRTFKNSVQITYTGDEALPRYVTTSLDIEPGVVSCFGNGAGEPQGVTGNPYGLGFDQLPEEWRFAHRCLRYSTVYKEEITGQFRPVVLNINYPLRGGTFRVGTFAPITDGGGTFTSFSADLELNSASFTRKYTVPDGTGSSLSEETTEHVFTNMLTAPEVIYKRVYAGHAVNDVSSYIRGAFSYTSKNSEGSTSGTSFNTGENITVPAGDYFSVKPLIFLSTLPHYPRDSFFAVWPFADQLL